MDPLLMKFIKETTPQMTYDIVNGLAVKHLPYAMKYIDSILTKVFKDLLPGLKYVGMVKCSPEEELRKEQRKKNDKIVIDTARSDLYLVGLDFTYVDPTKIDPITGKPDLKEYPLKRKYLFLPFAGPGGSIFVSGSRFFINTVMSGTVLSFEKECIFVRLLRDKFAVRRIPHTVYANGQIETVSVVWSRIHHMTVKEKTVKVFCPLILYLLCNYGLTQTLKIYGKADCKIGTDDINSQNYPSDEWCIYESARALRKRGIKKAQGFSDFKIAVKQSENNKHLQSLIGTVFYLLDHFPDKFLQQSWLESKEKWMIIMGYIYFGENENVGILIEDVQEHFKSLDEYIDDIVREKLRTIGIEVKDIYELFAILIENFGTWMVTRSNEVNSLYNKELSVLDDALFTVTEAIFNCYFKLKSTAKSYRSAQRKLKITDIEKIMDATIRSGVIFSITKPTKGAVTSISYSGDNKFMKITSAITPQKRSSSSNDAGQLEDPENRLHVSFVDVGNYSNLTGKTPVGNQRINPYVNLDANLKVLKSPSSREALDRTQEMIKRL